MSPTDSSLGTLLKPPDAWNHPNWFRHLAPLSAGAGALAAPAAAGGLGYDGAVGGTIGAAVSFVIAWFILAALD